VLAPHAEPLHDEPLHDEPLHEHPLHGALDHDDFDEPGDAPQEATS
jgi:hypothetical protein